MSLPLDPKKPWRKASNSCHVVRNDMVTCFQKSRCFQEEGMSYKKCLHNMDPEFVPERCQQLRQAYSVCRKNLLNAKYRMRGNSLSF
mmetsp:Transcript_33830/g.67009  ORF Transcript_33830/g.67009 Transcript_33830/m.67009 type:complete len:87 (-) Transcript_33830:956-1216(-)